MYSRLANVRLLPTDLFLLHLLNNNSSSRYNRYPVKWLNKVGELNDKSDKKDKKSKDKKKSDDSSSKIEGNSKKEDAQVLTHSPTHSLT